MRAVLRGLMWLAVALVPAMIIAVTGMIWGQRFSFWWNYERGVPEGWHVVSEPNGCQWLWSHVDMNSGPRPRPGITPTKSPASPARDRPGRMPFMP